MCGREIFGSIAFIAMIWRQALQAFNTVQVEKGVCEKLSIMQQFWCVIMVPSLVTAKVHQLNELHIGK
jgi:hypothetical protein